MSRLSLCFALAVAAFVASPVAQSAAVFQRPAAPGQLVDIGHGQRLHVLCKGSGAGPTVLIEAGLSQWSASSTYGRAQDAIAASGARVCVYDRAGLGWSDVVPDGRTHNGMVEDLHKLLAAMKVPPPYVLVGHSMGGLLVRLYAKTYRGEVAGVVLADATSESTLYDAKSANARASIIAQIEKGLVNARPGVPMLELPKDTAAEVAMSFTPEIFRAVKDEYQAIDRTPAELRGSHGYGTLDDIPLVVVRRGRTAQPPSATDESWRAEQELLPALSTNSVLLVAANSGHVIPYDEPAIIADAVRRVMDACRTKGRIK